MNVAIIGYGVEGKSAEAYWLAKGDHVTIRDAKDGPDYLDNLDQFDLIVRTPSLRPDELTQRGIDPAKITSVVAETLAESPALIIGVTGTKGKGTTSTLIAKILQAAGNKVWLGGNIGIAPLDFLPQVSADDIIVLELSSYQLMDLRVSPQIAVCLMLAPDHLNWHRDMAEYIEAKSSIFRYQEAGDLAIYKAGDELATKISGYSSGQHLPYGSAPGAEIRDGQVVIGGVNIIAVGQVGLRGPHNLENICAAVTATWELVGHDPEPVRAAIAAFAGLEHRLEIVRMLGGVTYVDDSFATTPETAMAAIKSFTEPKVMILGGSDKGASYGELARAVASGNVIHVLLIGDTAAAIADALRDVGYDHFTLVQWQGMKALVETCRQITEPGDFVLLSTACASFGLFSNYKDRGEQFAAAVRQIGHPINI